MEGQKGRITLLDLLATLLWIQPQMWLAFWFLGCKYTLLAHVQLFKHHYPQSFFIEHLSIPSSLISAGICLECRTLHLALPSTFKFTWASLIMSMSCMTSCPLDMSQLDHSNSANSQRVHSILLCHWCHVHSGGSYTLTFSYGSHAYRSLSSSIPCQICFSHTLPSQPPLLTTEQCPHALSRIPPPASLPFYFLLALQFGKQVLTQPCCWLSFPGFL